MEMREGKEINEFKKTPESEKQAHKLETQT
jgi:hypothetical protein